MKNICETKLYQRIISTQKLKLLGEFTKYDLYNSLTHSLKWKRLETCRAELHTTMCLIFIKKDEGGESWTHNYLVNKTLIPYQRTFSTKKLKLVGERL
jgi:hypothetical protein